jgi:hypothetical protein
MIDSTIIRAHQHAVGALRRGRTKVFADMILQFPGATCAAALAERASLQKIVRNARETYEQVMIDHPVWKAVVRLFPKRSMVCGTRRIDRLGAIAALGGSGLSSAGTWVRGPVLVVDRGAGASGAWCGEPCPRCCPCRNGAVLIAFHSSNPFF